MKTGMETKKAAKPKSNQASREPRRKDEGVEGEVSAVKGRSGIVNFYFFPLRYHRLERRGRGDRRGAFERALRRSVSDRSIKASRCKIG